MEYKIDENYVITTDEHNITLNRIRVKGEDSVNAGEEYYVALGFYGTLEYALKGYLKHSLRKDSQGVKNTTEILDRIKVLHKFIESFCDEYKKNNKVKGK